MFTCCSEFCVGAPSPGNAADFTGPSGLESLLFRLSRLGVFHLFDGIFANIAVFQLGSNWAGYV